jgi:hypothetical protein
LKYPSSGTPLKRTVILSPARIGTLLEAELFAPEFTDGLEPMAAGPGEEGCVLPPLSSPPQPLNRTQARKPHQQVSFFMNRD